MRYIIQRYRAQAPWATLCREVWPLGHLWPAHFRIHDVKTNYMFYRRMFHQGHGPRHALKDADVGPGTKYTLHTRTARDHTIYISLNFFCSGFLGKSNKQWTGSTKWSSLLPSTSNDAKLRDASGKTILATVCWDPGWRGWRRVMDGMPHKCQ